MAEWSNVPDSKSGVDASLPWVRIPPSPPLSIVLYGFVAIQQLCYQNSYQIAFRIAGNSVVA